MTLRFHSLRELIKKVKTVFVREIKYSIVDGFVFNVDIGLLMKSWNIVSKQTNNVKLVQ